MVRTKKIYREDLLKGAYTLAVTEGLQNFRARKIARVMNCSTQPIYREFKNMDELKAATYIYILDRIKQLFPSSTENHLLEIQTVVCSFAKAEPQAFQQFFLADQECHKRLKTALITHYTIPQTTPITDEMWYALIGKASLISFGQSL